MSPIHKCTASLDQGFDRTSTSSEPGFDSALQQGRKHRTDKNRHVQTCSDTQFGQVEPVANGSPLKQRDLKEEVPWGFSIDPRSLKHRRIEARRRNEAQKERFPISVSLVEFHGREH